ncbi:hypothetical protein [Tenacibaculum sp. 190524A02b]|uniref:Flagellar FliJ protein n=1 Tax=Tenacibaculum vairaonense TaxID=3137860 RepID=A0ABP1FGP1_9FLAO
MLKEIKKHLKVNNTLLALYAETSVDFINSITVGRRTFSIKIINTLLPLFESLEMGKTVQELKLSKNLRKEINQKRDYTAVVKKLDRRIRNGQEQIEKDTLIIESYLRGMHACEQLLQNTNNLKEHQIKWLQLREKHLAQKYAAKQQESYMLQAEIAAKKAKREFLLNY